MLTDVGISLHKQGQVLEHVGGQAEEFEDEGPRQVRPDRSDGFQSHGEDRDKTVNLLRRRMRLESIVSKLSFLVGNRNNLVPLALQQTINLQEDRLVRS